MTPFEIMAFMLFVLPALIIKEGYRMLTKHISKQKLWTEALYIFILILTVIVIILWLKGYR